MELQTVIDRWHSEQKAKAHYRRHTLAVGAAVALGVGIICVGYLLWGAVLIIAAATVGFCRHAVLDVLVHHTSAVPDELLLLIAGEPVLSDNFKRQLATALHTESVITFGELRELAWRVEREDLKATARTQEGFRTLARDYPAPPADSTL